MPNDPATLIALGVGAVIVIWLVFSVLKKVMGLVVLLAIAGGAYLLWTNPALLNQVMDYLPF